MTQEAQGTSRPEYVFTRLLLDIVMGRIEPGSSLPSERVYAEELQVSRSVVREALKRLEQLGLVKAQQGGSTRANDFRSSAGLDLLTVLAPRAPLHEDAIAWLVSLLEMRAALGADTARLCTLRASQDARDAILDTALRMEKASEVEQIVALEVDFWNRVNAGADNIAYRLAYNTMMKVIPAYYYCS